MQKQASSLMQHTQLQGSEVIRHIRRAAGKSFALVQLQISSFWTMHSPWKTIQKLCITSTEETNSSEGKFVAPITCW
jgi:hypothetical protein